MVLQLTRYDWRVEVPAVQWAAMIAFLVEHGWGQSVPMFVIAGDDVVIDDDQAKHFAAAGQIILDETLNDPAGACSAIHFDLGLLAGLVTFAAEGGFTISADADERPGDGRTSP